MKKLSLIVLLLLINVNCALALRPTANLSDERVLTATDRRGFSFESIPARDTFFGISSNSVILKTGIPVDVNEGPAVTTFVWTGDDQPVIYDPDLFIEQALNSGPGTLFLGIDSTSLSSAAKTLNFNSAFGDKAIPLGQAFTDDGSTGPTHFRFTKINDFSAADVFDSQLSSPSQWIFTGTIFNSYTEGLTIRPATSGTLVLKAYAGIADTFPIVIDTTFEILPGDVGNIRNIPFPNGLLAVAGDDQLIVVSGVDLFGGLQTNVTLPFLGQTVGFLQSDTFVLTLSDIMTRNQLDDYVFLNSKYSAPIEKSGGISVTTLPTTTVATVTASEFIPGVDTISNLNVTTVESNIFAQGDLVCYISNPGQPNANDEIYEVHDHTGTTLQLRGIGLNALVEDFTQDQFVNLISSGTFTKIGVAALKMTATELLAGFGNTTPISFSAVTGIVPGGSDTQVQFNNGGVFGGISGIATDGTNLDVSGRIDGAGVGGLLLLRAGSNSPTGGPIQLEGGGASTTGGKVQSIGGLGGVNGGNVESLGGEGPNGKGGSILSIGGNGGVDGGSGDGGDINQTAGQGGFNSGKGGDINLTSGVAEGLSATSGSIRLDIGDSIGGGPIGNVLLAPTRGRASVGTFDPNAPFDVTGDSPGNVGGFASGALHITSPSTLVNANAVITGHNSFGGNRQLWYLGSASSSNQDIAFINRQDADISFSTNNIERLNISRLGVFETPGDLDLTTGTGGVFKFNSDAFRAGLDAIEYVEIGHGGGNGFINAVGDGGLDFRFEGVTLATFTDFGHLHLMTNVDQKHTLKIITADNLNDTGLAWENSGGSFTGTIFRTDVGTNRADLVFAVGINSDIDLLIDAIRIHGADAEVGKVDIINEARFNAYPNTRDDGTPVNILSTDANGNLISSPNESITLNQDALGVAAGSINYDPVKGTMNVRNIFPGSSIQVGHENVVFVVNNTGSTITDGKVVNVGGYDVTVDALEIALALADSVENTEVLGITTTTMLDGEVGLVTVFGRVNDLDTTSFTEGQDVFLSDTVAGGLTTTKPAIPIQMGHVGKVDASVGFIQVEIKEMEKSIFGGFSHSLDQTFSANVSAPIQFNKNEEFSGITHSETLDNDEFTFVSGGVYQATAEPQYTRTTGGGTDVLNMFLARDTGSGFVNVPNSNVKFSVNAAGVTLVSPLTATFRVNAGDKIRFMAQVEDANLILDAFPVSGLAPNDIPLTPSIIMNIVRIGD